MQNNTLESLLRRVEFLNQTYGKLQAENNFNVFSILRNETDEVHLHSQFICELLNPLGTHGRNEEFLEIFIQTIGIEDFSLEGVEVHKEKDNIDILIKNYRQAIIIENKIGAGDQPKQLERYYKLVKNYGFKEIHVFYLTLGGNPASKESLGILDSELVSLISYKGEIAGWLEECIEKSARQPTLREAIIQYKNLIQKLTGTSMSNEFKLELIDLLKDYDYVHQASAIASNWNHVKFHIERNFWEDFEKVISKEYDILSYQKWNTEMIIRNVHYRKNRYSWYGLMFEIANLEKARICLFVERGNKEVYYGITSISKDKDKRLPSNIYLELYREMSSISEITHSEIHTWYGINNLKPHINLEILSDEETLNLIKPDYRQKYISKNWDEIKEYITKVGQVIENLDLK